MTADQPEPRRAIADAPVVEMYTDGRLDGLVGQLRQDYNKLPRYRLEEAVLDGFVVLYKKLLAEDVSAPLAFVYKVARNSINKELDRTLPLLQLPDDNAADAVGAKSLRSEHDEVRALRREHAFRYLLAVVDSWTNGNVKQVTRLVIQGATEGEPLEAPEIAARLGLNPDSVRTWKKRGLDRLAAHVEALQLDFAEFGEEELTTEDIDEREDDRVE